MEKEAEKALEELRERISSIRQRMQTLEWDKKHSQINPEMERKYQEIKKEYAAQKAEFDKLNNDNPGASQE